MYEWLKENRGEFNTRPVTAPPVPVPDGAMMIKEMYPYPAAACAGVNVLKLKANTQSSAVMVRDSNGSHDGWFWGWYGWGGSGWGGTGPPRQTAPIPTRGLGNYAPTAILLGKTTRPSRPRRTSRVSPASRWCFS